MTKFESLIHIQRKIKAGTASEDEKQILKTEIDILMYRYRKKIEATLNEEPCSNFLPPALRVGNTKIIGKKTADMKAYRANYREEHHQELLDKRKEYYQKHKQEIKEKRLKKMQSV